jgi:hypothetical protein
VGEAKFRALAEKSSKRQGQIKAIAKFDAIIRCIPPVAIIGQSKTSELTRQRGFRAESHSRVPFAFSARILVPGGNTERPIYVDPWRTAQVTAASGAAHHPAAAASDRRHGAGRRSRFENRDPELIEMSVNERPLQARSSARLPVVSENALLATIAIGFLILHILAGTILLQAPARATTAPQQETRPSSYD